jgi:hypothetical protein
MQAYAMATMRYILVKGLLGEAGFDQKSPGQICSELFWLGVHKATK